jgi:hypothetical protein
MPMMLVYWLQDTSDPAKCSGNPCQSMEGWYDDMPARPHGGRCDCSIWPYVGWATYIYKNFRQEDAGEVSHESSRSVEYENPHPTESIDESLTIEVEIKTEYSVQVDEIMTHFGASGGGSRTETVTHSQSVIIPPRHRAILKATISGTTTHYSADKWATFTNNDPVDMTGAPEEGEVFIGPEEGGTKYEESNNVDFDVVLEPL